MITEDHSTCHVLEIKPFWRSSTHLSKGNVLLPLLWIHKQQPAVFHVLLTSFWLHVLSLENLVARDAICPTAVWQSKGVSSCMFCLYLAILRDCCAA